MLVMYYIPYVTICNVMLENKVCNASYIVLSFLVYNNQMLSYNVLSLHACNNHVYGRNLLCYLTYFSYFFPKCISHHA